MPFSAGLIAKFAFGGGENAGACTLPKYSNHQQQQQPFVTQPATVQDLVNKFGQGLMLGNNNNSTPASTSLSHQQFQPGTYPQVNAFYTRRAKLFRW